jgi:hypothetical protein
LSGPDEGAILAQQLHIGLLSVCFGTPPFSSDAAKEKRARGRVKSWGKTCGTGRTALPSPVCELGSPVVNQDTEERGRRVKSAAACERRRVFNFPIALLR